MMNWKYTLNVSSFYYDDGFEIKEKGNLMSKAIKQKFPAKWFNVSNEDYNDDIDEIADLFETVDSIEEFDDIMESLYNFCDYDKTAWIKTQ